MTMGPSDCNSCSELVHDGARQSSHSAPDSKQVLLPKQLVDVLSVWLSHPAPQGSPPPNIDPIIFDIDF
jgi:hypothetical protein